MFDPVTATIGALAVSGGASVLGAREQRKAQDRATATAAGAEAARLGLSREQFEFSKRLISEGKPIRDALREAQLRTIPAFSEAATESLARLRSFAEGEEGDPNFQARLDRDIRSIQRGLAPFGLTDSSAAGEAIGEATALRSLGEFDRRLALQRSLAGLVPTGGPSVAGVGANISGQATNLAGQAGSLAALRAQIQSQSPRAGLFSDISSAASTVGTLGALGAFSRGGGGSSGGSVVPSFTFDPTLRR